MNAVGMPDAAIGFVPRPAGGECDCECPWGVFLCVESSWAWEWEETPGCCCFPLADTTAGSRSMEKGEAEMVAVDTGNGDGDTMKGSFAVLTARSCCWEISLSRRRTCCGGGRGGSFWEGRFANPRILAGTLYCFCPLLLLLVANANEEGDTRDSQAESGAWSMTVRLSRRSVKSGLVCAPSLS